jgi:hypothetical protein
MLESSQTLFAFFQYQLDPALLEHPLCATERGIVEEPLIPTIFTSHRCALTLSAFASLDSRASSCGPQECVVVPSPKEGLP